MAGSMAAPADDGEEGGDSIASDTLVVDTLANDPIAPDTLAIDTLATDTIVPVVIVNGETPYESLAEAIYFAEDSIVSNIQLVDDTSLGTIVIKEGLTIELDLNGHILTVDSLGLYNYGKLTIVDSLENVGSLSMDHGNTGLIYNFGELTIDGGSFVNSSAEASYTDLRRCLISFGGSKTHIKDGKFNSTGQVLCLYGEVTIDNGEFVTTGNLETVASYDTHNQLVINGGTFANKADKPVSGTDARRCLWTNVGTDTHITDGTFTSDNQVLFLQGTTTIDKGSFTSAGNSFVVGNYSSLGQLTISGGTFRNLGTQPQEESDQRCCLFTNRNTKTVIDNASFSSAYQVLVLNGDAVINDGDYVTTGNTNVLGNYNPQGELVISGGTFTNECELAEDNEETDNRRCLWTSSGTTTTISGGTFTNDATAQTITVYGDATVSGGTIINKGHGSGIASNGSVEVSGCRISAWNIFICWEGAKLVCSSGLFSEIVPDELLAEGCQCVDNTEPSTREAYPYKVVKGTPGDVNGDGNVDVADISTVISIMAGSADEEQAKAGDVNGDGNVDVADISTIISIMAGN